MQVPEDKADQAFPRLSPSIEETLRFDVIVHHKNHQGVLFFRVDLLQNINDLYKPSHTFSCAYSSMSKSHSFSR